MADAEVMVIGLDAATLELVRPWAAEGRLPNLARFLECGASGPLRTTLPVHSSAAWSTFATGTNPGKHGIVDFVQFTPNSYKPLFASGARRQGETFWEIAGRQGVRGGIVNVPITYPPREYNGFIITGMLSPGVRPEIAAPREVFGDLLGVSPDYAIDPEMSKSGGSDVRLKYLEAVMRTMQARVAAAVGLYRKYRPPLFCVVFRAADQVCHYFWHDFEALQAGRASTDTDRRLGEAIPTIYRKLDQAVGALVELAGDRADVLILSDHGAGPLRRGLNMQAVLAESGLLAKARLPWISRIARRAIWAFVHLAPLAWKNRIKTGLPGLARRAAEVALTHSIDFTRTKAYPTCDSEGIFINLRGRQPLGVVEPGQYEAVRDEVIRLFSELADPETGRRVARKVHRREEIWSGPELENLPDLFVELADKIYEVRAGSHGGDKMFYPLPEASPGSLSWSGDHRRDGLLMAMGPHVRHAQISGAQIADVPATILALLGCSIPEDFDGRALTEILTDDVELPGRIAPRREEPASREVYTDEDQAALARRLKQLGYL